jgi:hypothetical protein
MKHITSPGGFHFRGPGSRNRESMTLVPMPTTSKGLFEGMEKSKRILRA